MSEVLNVEKLFGENVFTLGKMQERPLQLVLPLHADR